MADSTYNLGINVSVGSVGVNSTLNAIEQRFQKFSKSVQASSQSMNASMKGSLSTIDQEMNKFDQLNDKMQKVSTGKDSVASKSQKMEQTTKKENKALNDLDKTTQNHTKAIKGNNTATENWLSSRTRSIGIALRSTVVWGLATTAIYGSQRALREAHQTMMEVNSEMIALRRVMSGATTDFASLRDTAGNLGVEFAANIQDVVSSMVEWGRQGRNQVEVIELTEAALLATNVAQMDSSQAVDLLTSALLQFNMEASESVAIIDRWNEVANNYAINATNIAMSIRESGAAAQSAGISMDELIGMTTALSAATAKTGNRIGRSLRTVFSRMMGDMTDTGESVGKVEVALNSVGVALRQSEDNYRNMTDVITDLAVQWDDLDQVMQANIARAIGGRRRYSDVIALIENWDMALDATQTSMGSLNSAIEENEKYMESVEAKWEQVTATFNQIINTLTEGGLDDWSIAVAEAIANLLGGINNLVRGVQALKNPLSALSVALVGGSGLVYAFNTLNISLVSSGAMLGTTMTATTALTTAFSGLLSVLNPVYLAIGAGTLLLGRAVKNYGDLQNSIDEAVEAKENFAKITEEVNILNKTEIENSKELINQYSDLASETEDLLSNTQISSVFTDGNITGYFSNLAKSMIPLYNDDADKAIDNLEILANVFPNLKEQADGTDEFFKLIQEELKTMNSYLENSAKWIIDETDAMYENTTQGMRNAKMLQDKRDRYMELSKISDKTVAQEQEMLQIQSELRRSYYELASAETDFATALNNLTENEMKKFGDGGTEVNKTIDEMTTNIEKLEEKEESLNKAYQKSGDRIDELEKQRKSLMESDSSTAKEINAVLEALEQERVKYATIGEVLDETREKQTEYINNIEALQNGLENLDPAEFLSNFEEATNILEGFSDELEAILIQISDVNTVLETEQNFNQWWADIADQDASELLKSQVDAVKTQIDNLQDLGSEAFNIFSDIDSNATREELKSAIEESFEIPLDQLSFDIDDIYEAFDTGGAEGLKDLIMRDIENLVPELQDEMDTLSEQLDFTEAYEELMSIDSNDLASLTQEEINQYLTQVEKMLTDEGQSMGNTLAQQIGLGFNTQDLIDLKFDLRFEGNLQEGEDRLSDLYNELSQITDVEKIELDLSGNTMENINELDRGINHILMSALRIEDVDFSNMSMDEISEMQNKFQDTEGMVENIQSMLEEATGETINDSEVTEGLRKWIEQYEKYVTMVQQQKIDAIVTQKEIEMLGEHATALRENELEIQRFEELMKEATDPKVVDRIQSIVDALEDARIELEIMKELEGAGLEDILSAFTDFDVDDLSSIEQARDMISDLRNDLNRFDVSLADIIGDSEISDEQLEEIKTAYGLSEEQIADVFATINEYISDTERNWNNALSQAFSESFNRITDEMSRDKKLAIVFEESLRAGIENVDRDVLQNMFDSVGSTLEDFVNIDGFGEGFSDALMGTADALSQGKSLGQSLLQGIGTVVTGSSVGGSIIGTIGQSIFGGVEGRDEMEAAKKINQQIESAQRELEDFGIFFDAQLASYEDNAGALQGMFGGEDWDVSGLGQAKIDLEEMEEILERVGQTAQDMFGELPGLISEGLSYNDFKSNFEQSIGQAMQDAIINKLIETQAIERQIQQIAGMIEQSIGAEGQVYEERLDAVQDEIDRVVERASYINEVVKGLDLGIGGGEADVTMDRSFRAGSTSSITYQNTFAVQSQIFLDDTSAAREAAKKLAPYIQEYLERHT